MAQLRKMLLEKNKNGKIGNKNFIDNEIIKDQNGPDELKKSLYISDFEKII